MRKQLRNIIVICWNQFKNKIMSNPIKSILVIYESPSNTTAFRYIRCRDGATCEGYLHAGQNNLLKAFHYNDKKGWRCDSFHTVDKLKSRQFSYHIKDLVVIDSSPERIREFVLNSEDFKNDKNLI